MYAYFKKEGPQMRKDYIKGIITADEFEAWLDSTMLRKTK